MQQPFAVRPFTQGGGQVRLLGFADGSYEVLKWRHASKRTLQQLQTSAHLVDDLRRRGWPFPVIKTVEQVGDYLVSLDDFSPGAHPADISNQVIDRMLVLNRAARGGGGGGRRWALTLLGGLEGGDTKVDVGALRSTDLGQRALREARSSAANLLSRSAVDLVHGDFSPGNVLVDGAGRLAAVVDWDDVTAGDGVFDLVTLEWDIALWGRSVRHRLPDLRAEQAVRAAPEVVDAYRWYLTCRNLSWATGTPDEHVVGRTAKALVAFS